MRFPRSLSLVLLVPVAGLGLAVLPADAAPVVGATVQVTDFAFTPATVKVAQGRSVAWKFHSEHTTTSNQGFWDSGHRMSGTYTVVFANAGTFGYRCTMHPGMVGQVLVPLRSTGTSNAGWKVFWSSASSTPSNIRYDFQYRRAGTTAWVSSRAKSASRSAAFNPARSASYQLRARTWRGSKVSGWSPVLTVKIT